MLPVLFKNKILSDAEVKSTHHRCCWYPTTPLTIVTQADEQLNKGTNVPPYLTLLYNRQEDKQITDLASPCSSEVIFCSFYESHADLNHSRDLLVTKPHVLVAKYKRVSSLLKPREAASSVLEG